MEAVGEREPVGVVWPRKSPAQKSLAGLLVPRLATMALSSRYRASRSSAKSLPDYVR
jgi:hypothetical protein